MLKNKQSSNCVKKVNECVNWYINSKINGLWENLIGTIKNHYRICSENTGWKVEKLKG